MLSLRDSNKTIRLGLLLLAVTACSDEKPFENGQEASERIADLLRPEDDPPVRLPSMITGSQFLVGCQSRSKMTYQNVPRFRLDCEVKTPSTTSISGVSDWKLQFVDGLRSPIVLPSTESPSKATLLFVQNLSYPFQVSAKIKVEGKKEISSVQHEFREQKEVLPAVTPSSACFEMYSLMFEYAKYVAGMTGPLSGPNNQYCYESYTDVFLRCQEGRSYFHPSGCWH